MAAIRSRGRVESPVRRSGRSFTQWPKNIEAAHSGQESLVQELCEGAEQGGTLLDRAASVN